MTANLAVPGSGSLVAGRVSGYFQLVLAMTGVAITTVFGVKFMLWYVNNWANLQQSQPDMAANFQELWSRLRPAVVGFAVFVTGLAWALASSVGILRESSKARSASPPVFDQGPQ